MTDHLLMTPRIEALLAATDPAGLCLVSDHAQDAVVLSGQAGYNVAQFEAGDTSLADKQVIFIPIAMEGFFDLLQRIDRSRVQVVAIINDLAEEFVTAKFVGVTPALRVKLNVNADIPQRVLYPAHCEAA